MYGVAFPDAKQLTEYKRFLEEAEKRNHRKIGREQELFFFHELSPGSCFWLPHGARIYNTLMDFLKVNTQIRVLRRKAVVLISVMLSLRLNTANVDMARSCHRICTIPNCGRPPDIGNSKDGLKRTLTPQFADFDT